MPKNADWWGAIIKLKPKAYCPILSAPAEYSPKAQSLGAASVVAAIGSDPRCQELVKAEVIDSLPGESPSSFAQRVLTLEPDIIGFSVYIWNRAFLEATARALRQVSPATVLFAGGPELTGNVASFTPQHPFDFLFVGEAESSIARFLHSTLLAKPGAISSVGQSPNAIINCPVPALETLPSPWLLSTVPLNQGGALWELTRGCPFICAYCFESKGNQRLRRFPLERIKAELTLFVQRGISQITVLDPTFNADRARALSLLRLIRDQGRGIHFSFEVRAEFLELEQAQLFAEIACSVQVGLQSADPQVMARLDRPFNPTLFAKKIKLLDQAGVIYGLDLIYGLPGESFDGFIASLDFALQCRPNHLDIFPLAVLPGTALWDRADSLGLEWDHNAPYLLKTSAHFSASDMLKAAALARAVDIFYNAGRAVPWFGVVISAMGTSSGQFLLQVVERLDRYSHKRIDPLNHACVEGFQVDCVSNLLGSEHPCIDLILDLIQLHGAYSRAALEGQKSELKLHYHPDALFSPLSLKPRSFIKSQRAKLCRVCLFRSKSGEVIVRSI